jgi:peptidoglycan L-alanyl-D-glutamate endopeptidase CwlK
MIQRRNADPKLQAWLDELIKYTDFAIICSYRNKDAQDKAVAEKKSKTPWPTSKHNSNPSQAVDIVPFSSHYGLMWNDSRAFYILAGHAKTIAQQMGLRLRWGGDWDNDNNLDDQKFNDLPHWEIL